MQRKSGQKLALVALLSGAAGIGFAPIFVRLSEVGPSATGFYRVFLALPVLWLVTLAESGPTAAAMAGQARRLDEDGRGTAVGARRAPSSRLWLCGLAGFLFAGDLAFWHWSIRLTSVANSTLLTNCAPFFVTLGARMLFRERVTVLLLIGLGVASLGAAMLVGASLQLTFRHLLGDFLALVTAVFYGSYLLTVKYLRLSYSSARILALSGVVSAAFLLLIASLSGELIHVSTMRGWIILLGLAVVSHLGGQGLIGYALAHLPAGFSSVGLLFQPVVAALLAWGWLHESLSPLQIVGGLVILLGIGLAGRGRSP